MHLQMGCAADKKLAAVRNRRTGLGFKVVDSRGRGCRESGDAGDGGLSILRTVKNDTNLPVPQRLASFQTAQSIKSTYSIPDDKELVMRIACAALAMSFLFGGAVLAAETPAESPVQKTKQEAWPRSLRFLKGLNLTADQKAEVEGLLKEYGPKLKEDRQAFESLLTPEQKKARQDAIDVAKAAELKARDLRKAVQKAIQLTPEQKAKQAELNKQVKAAHQELRQKVMDILTPEQKELLKAKLQARKKK